MTHLSFLHISRRVTQIGFVLFVFLMPVLDILRYDVATKELFLFGSAWSLGLREGFYAQTGLEGATHVAVHFFLNAILPWVVVLAVFPLLGFLFGRLFCGWLCPEGALFELAEFLTLKIIGRRNIFMDKPNDPPQARGSRWVYGVLSLVLLITIPPLTGVFLSGYFIAPTRVWQEISSLNPSFGLKAGVIGISVYMIVTTVFVRHVFCRYVCAPGLMQMLFGWASPVSLRIRFDRTHLDTCTDCRRCETVCFMGVRPRHPKRDINCVNCGECITACKQELGERKGLFQYARGQGGSNRTPANDRKPLCDAEDRCRGGSCV